MADMAAVHLQVRNALSGELTQFEADEAMTIGELEWRLDLQRQRRNMLVEKRVAPDGNAYTREAFAKFYGGLTEWEAAPEGGNPDHLKARLCRGPDKLASNLTVKEAALAEDAEVQLVLVSCRGCCLVAVSRCWENLVGYPDREETEADPGDVQGVAQEVGLLPALKLLARDADQLEEDEQRLLYLTAEAIMRLANGDAAVAADSSREGPPAHAKVAPSPAEAEAAVPQGLLLMFGGFAAVSMSMSLRPNEVERFVGSAERLRTRGAELGFLVLAPTAARKCMGADLQRLMGAVEAILRRWAGKTQASDEMADVLRASLGPLLSQAERMGLPEQVDAVMQVLREVAPTVYRDLITD